MLHEGPREVGWTYKGTPYIVTIDIREVYGRLEPVGISIRTKDRRTRRVMDKSLLRALPLPELFTQALTSIQALVNRTLEDRAQVDLELPVVKVHLESDPKTGLMVDRTTSSPPFVVMDKEHRDRREDFWREAREQALHAKEVVRATGEGNGRRWGPDHYREVLDVVAFAEAQGLPKNRVVAEFFGLTADTASKHISRAPAMVAKADAKQMGRKKL